MENDLIEQDRRKLFIDKKYTELIQKLNEDLETANNPQQQVDIQYWFGRCYLEQASQTDDATLFDKASEYFEKRLKFAEELSGDTALKKQATTQFWLGRCYFDHALPTNRTILFDQAREYFQKQLALAKKLYGDNSTEEQFYAQSWLGHCYLKQGKKNKGNIKQNENFLPEAEKHFNEMFKLAKKITDKTLKKQLTKKIRRDFQDGACRAAIFAIA